MWTFVRRTCLAGKGDVGLHEMVQMPANRYGGRGGLDKLRAGSGTPGRHTAQCRHQCSGEGRRGD